MTLLDIFTVPDPVLRKKARKTANVTPEIRQLVQDMVETMRDAPGVGLAAPQVGIGQRVIVVEYADEPENPADPDSQPAEPVLYSLINPEIVRSSRKMLNGIEACLSVPGFAGDVDRHQEITVEAMNLQGDVVRIRAKGWLARIFQHEIDHLNGVLYVDRAIKVWEVRPEDMQDNV